MKCVSGAAKMASGPSGQMRKFLDIDYFIGFWIPLSFNFFINNIAVCEVWLYGTFALNGDHTFKLSSEFGKTCSSRSSQC